MFNKFIGIGRATRDSELKYSNSGVGICNFSLAIDRSRANKDGQRETDFVNVRTLGKLAEICGEGVSKGKLYAVEGELHIEHYDGQDGQKKTAVYVLANNVRFLSPKDGGQAQSGTIDLDGLEEPDEKLPF